MGLLFKFVLGGFLDLVSDVFFGEFDFVDGDKQSKECEYKENVNHHIVIIDMTIIT